jgi:protein involved in polysaccharide export with SLBB domain
LIAAGLSVVAMTEPAFPQQTGLPSGMTREQALQLLQNRPDLVRQRLRESGLTEPQIRQRLQAAGLPSSLLDPFLAGGDTLGVAVSEDVLRALDLLGVPPTMPAGVDSLPLVAGAQLPIGLERAAPPSRLFGLDVFRGRTTRFQPLLAGPVPETYRVGPGDVMVLVLTGEVELVHELQVTREGFIVIPQVGQLYVINVTMADLRALLRQRLGRSYSGILRGTTHFDVTIARLRTIQVFVIGEVVQPGAYQLASVATVLNALYAAGGPTERGNFREIRVERARKALTTLDLYDYLLRGSTASDVVLEQGDVIFVPIRGVRASIDGAVVRPGVYELDSGESLDDLVRMAGGFRADAQLRRIAVHRILPPAQQAPAPAPRAVIDVSLRVPRPDADRQEGVGGGRSGKGGGDTTGARSEATDGVVLPVVVPGLTLENGDSVVVDSVLPAERSLYVTIAGMVNQPGQFSWRNGMTLRDLVLLARGPQVGADLREAEIARLPEDRLQGTLARTFRVPLDSTYLFERDSLGRYLGPAGVAFPAPGTAAEVALQPYDHVTIFRQPEFEFQRTVWVTGEVAYPGAYALERKDARLSSLVARAGGVLPTAYPGGSRFFRSLDEAGRVNVELATALTTPGGAEDLVLQPGDSLHVPEYIPIVRVMGAVNSPTSVRYQPGRGLNYYVANAGGYASDADKGRVSVRYADGSARVPRKFLLFTSFPEPGPGTVVTVPTKPVGEPFNVTQFLGSVAQILASTVAIIVIATR